MLLKLCFLGLAGVGGFVLLLVAMFSMLSSTSDDYSLSVESFIFCLFAFDFYNIIDQVIY